ncbi:MAG TPA: cob(I)yrinic acid a,c-diamide adenosyltransferase [Candidatus Paceibacterota bacterium]|nr:cob(I)yrinic acid a,c-diamide adenosyltransferase [Verrucomicrobiota bacterium]HSA09595.1 cob(I)yrinic acid a,c-diamide adenosyltransferase [Candidatus Paceibacterota bacterium]
MSIVTKRGDQGQTALMYNRAVSKSDARVEAYGAVDELNAAVGVARATVEIGVLREKLEALQQDLVRVMGELATAPEDLPRYVNDGHASVTQAMTAGLDGWIREIEAAKPPGKGWVMPGANQASAALDFARTVCRRAERRVCALKDAGQLNNPEVVVYLNRLSDLLWLLARGVEDGRR